MRKFRILISLLFVSLCCASSLWAAPDLLVRMEDIVVESSSFAEGVDLYVRKKPGMQSVMLVETTKDPSGKADNYAYRAMEWNAVNGDEVRYLDGKPLVSEYAKYSLISSTVVTHPELGECFHIFIPPVLVYGYPWARNGTVEIGKGTFVNIRTFSKPYADYTGEFADNPFMFDFKDVKPVMTDNYNSIAAEKFAELAESGNGLLTFSDGPETLPADLLAAIDALDPTKKADVVFAIDTTGSMDDDIDILRTEWIPQFVEQFKEFADLRIGLLLYRDYNDDYLYKRLPVKFFDFTTNLTAFKRYLNGIVIKGTEGGDIPEAVYEALYASIQYYGWRDDAQKRIILIGDAEPHPSPRGPFAITQETVTELASQKEISLDCIIVPDDKEESRGR